MNKRDIESAAARPRACKISYDAIPQALKDRPHFVLWGYRRRKDKWTKVPYQVNGQEAKADDPSTWNSFDEVVACGKANPGRYDGIGYEFSADDPFTGIDLDDAIDAETGQLKPWAQAVVDLLNSYCERSPSGTGVKIWVKASKPSKDRSRTRYEDGEIELYDQGRYFAVTGHHWPGTPATIEERQREVEELYHRLFDKKPPQPKAESSTRTLSDDELIAKAKAAKNGAKFERLLNGDTTDYNGDASRADAAFCSELAFWTDRDAARMDRIFRSSGLMRPKWDERRGEQTYGARTIEKACQLASETYRGNSIYPAANGSPPANGRKAEANGEDRRKPMLLLGVDEYRVNSDAIQILADAEAAPEVFQRGNMLARVLRNPTAGKHNRVDRPEGTPYVAAMPGPSLSELLTRIADICKQSTQKGETKLVRAHPPARTIAGILARGSYPGIRCLEAVVETPTLRPDGTVLDVPGWDAQTGLLYEPNADFPPIPQTPSRGQARAAADRLLDLVSNFPFAGETEDERFSHRAAFLAALLTPLARFAIDGPCPLFLFDANCPGAGKTLQTDTIALINTGRVMSRTAFPDDEAELRKRITAIALAGDRLMLFDNIGAGCSFGGAALDAALTGTTWRDRILGKNEMTAELPLYTVFYATGNNVMLRGDAQRRVIPCRLETREEKPEERAGFKYPNLLEHVRSHRPQLVCDALAILRAFAVADSPQAKLPTFGSYEGWSRLIRQTVFWVMEADPYATREKIRSADPALNTLAALLEGWSELPGGKTGISIAEALRCLNSPERKDDFSVLRGALMEWSRNDKLPGAGAIGYKLRSFRKRVIDGRMFDADVGHEKVLKWKVVQVS